MKILLSTFLIGTAVYTCNSVKVPVVTGIELTSLDSFVDGKYYGNGRVKIKNNNGIQISSKNVEFDLYYKNRLVSSGESQDDFVLKGKQETEVPIQFAVLVDSLLDYANEILQKDSVEFNSSVKGNFTAFNFKISHKQKIKLPTSMIVNGLVGQSAQNAFKLKNTRVKKIALETTTFNIDLHLKNNFPFDLTITKADFSVFNKKGSTTKVSQWGLDKKVTLPPGRDTVINSDVQVNNLQASSGILEKLMNRRIDFYIEGVVTIDYKGTLINVPLEQHLILNPLTGEVQVEQD